MKTPFNTIARTLQGYYSAGSCSRSKATHIGHTELAVRLTYKNSANEESGTSPVPVDVGRQLALDLWEEPTAPLNFIRPSCFNLI